MKFSHVFLSACAFSFLAHAAFDFEAGPIWNNEHAQEICPAICDDENLAWDGNWRTTIWEEMSVCTCGDFEAQENPDQWQQSNK